MGPMMTSLLQSTGVRHASDIKSLTSLRFFAAFWVLALHYTNHMPNRFADSTGLFQSGKLGVEFFFILSGFILTHVYVERIEAGRFDSWDFVRRRLARLYPIHLVTFLMVFAYWAAGQSIGLKFRVPQAYSLDSILPNLLLVHAWGFTDLMSWNYVSWSISAEWFAYLLFLPLSLAAIRSRLSPKALVGAAVAFFLVLYAAAPTLVGRPLTHLTYDFAFLRILPEFFLGIALYHLSRGFDLPARLALPLVLAAAGGVLLIAHWQVGDALAVLLLGLVIFGAASLERQGRGRWLKHPALVYLGEISYALYMVHGIVFIVCFKLLHLVAGPEATLTVWLLGPLALMLAFANAMLAHHWIELPGRRWMVRHLELPSVWHRSESRAAPPR